MIAYGIGTLFLVILIVVFKPKLSFTGAIPFFMAAVMPYGVGKLIMYLIGMK